MIRNSTPNMSPKQLEWRKRKMLQTIYNVVIPPRKTKERIRGYERGDLRCRSCLKWIDPNDSVEAKEIIHNEGGRPRHKDCPVNSFNGAYLSDRRSHRGAKHPANDYLKRY